MSVLMFVTLDNAVQIITDTLVSDENRKPVMYHHKVRSFPTLDMVAVLTGFASFADHWYAQLGQTPGLRDIEAVNEIAPAQLEEMYSKYQEHYAPEDIGTSTLYLFGFTESTERIVGYIYRSTKGFEPERFEGMRDFGVKPPPQQFELIAPENKEDAIELAVQLREENDSLRTDGPVAIGGELFLTFMDRTRVHTERIYRWPDYDELLLKMSAPVADEAPVQI